ncbi:hypothetical protein TWF696_000507 [Orbilia brochopaga]|uniref:Tetraspanin n=1 Tax=Orbilia brochopaga TaxID=3140254 RepID=A0AAV9VEJ2_9PEZI
MNTHNHTESRKLVLAPRRRGAMNANMLKIIIFSLFFLLSTILAAVAWYFTSTYSLPLPVPGLSIISTFFPIVEVIATAYTTRRILTPPSEKSKRPIPYLVVLINLVLLLVPAVLVTTSAPALFPANRCQLKQAWQGWYSARDEGAIRNVQDVLHCCGFGTVVDMPFPFPRNARKDKNDAVPPDACARRLGGGDVTRVSPCLPLWEGQMQKTVGFLIAAGAVILFAKLAFLMIAFGNPEAIGRVFRRPSTPEIPSYDENPGAGRIEDVVEHRDASDDEDDGPSDDDEEAVGRRGSRDPADSRTALLMPSANGARGLNGNGQHAYGATDPNWS